MALVFIWLVYRFFGGSDFRALFRRAFLIAEDV